jgi:hypothetical protein
VNHVTAVDIKEHSQRIMIVSPEAYIENSQV